ICLRSRERWRKSRNWPATGFCFTSLANDACRMSTKEWRNRKRGNSFLACASRIDHSHFVRHSSSSLFFVRHYSAPQTLCAPISSAQAFQLHDLTVIDKEVHVRTVIFDVPCEHIRISS